MRTPSEISRLKLKDLNLKTELSKLESMKNQSDHQAPLSVHQLDKTSVKPQEDQPPAMDNSHHQAPALKTPEPSDLLLTTQEDHKETSPQVELPDQPTLPAQEATDHLEQPEPLMEPLEPPDMELPHHHTLQTLESPLLKLVEPLMELPDSLDQEPAEPLEEPLTLQEPLEEPHTLLDQATFQDQDHSEPAEPPEDQLDSLLEPPDYQDQEPEPQEPLDTVQPLMDKDSLDQEPTKDDQ